MCCCPFSKNALCRLFVCPEGLVGSVSQITREDLLLPSDWIFLLSNFQTSTSKLISHQGNFDIFFPLTKEEDDAFRLIFRFWATLLLLLRGLSWHKGHFVGISLFLSIFRGSWPPYSFLASILSSAECQIKLSPFSLMHSYLIRTHWLKSQISINYVPFIRPNCIFARVSLV